MDVLVGSRQCPHLGFEIKNGLPCCRADDGTREACGRWAPNPAANGASSAGAFGAEPYFCTVLGTDALPPEALRLAARQKEAARHAPKHPPGPPRYQPPPSVTGMKGPLPSREAEPGADPVIPTYTLRSEGRKVGPNDKCPCGSGRKHKKCCGRGG